MTKEINHNFQTEIKVEGVSIGFDGAVNLASFFVADHHSDTLFYAKNFKTDLYSLHQWVNGNLFFSTTDFEDIFFKIIKYKGEENNSLSLFTKKLLSHTEPKNDNLSSVWVDNLNVSNGRFMMIDKNDIEKQILLKELNLYAENFFVLNDGVEVALKKFNFSSYELGDLNVFDTDLYYRPCALEINNFHLFSGNSYVKGKIILETHENDLFNLLNNSKVKLDLKSELFRDQLNKFIDLPDGFQPLMIDISATGNINDINFNKIKVSQKMLEFDAQLRVKEIFSKLPIQAQLDFIDLTLNASELTQTLPSFFLEKIPQTFLDFKPLKGQGSLYLSGLELQSDMKLSFENAKIQNNTTLHFEQNEGKIKLLRFDGVSQLKQLDLSPWSTKLGFFTSLLSFDGIRESNNEFSYNFNLDVDEILISDKKFKNFDLKGNYKEKTLTTYLKIDNQFIIANAALAFSWLKPQIKYQFDLNLDQLNLHLFDSELGGGKAIYSGDLNLFMVGKNFDHLQGNLLFKNIQFENQKTRNSFNDFILETNLSGQRRIVRTINSDIIDINIEGEFQLSKLIDLYSNALAESFPFVEKKNFNKSQDLIYDISIQANHLNKVFPQLLVDKKAVFRGILSTEDKVSKMTLSIPKITFNGISTENFEMLLDNQNPLFNTFVSIGKIQGDSYTIRDFNTLGIKRLDTLNFRTEFSSEHQTNDFFKLNYALTFEDGESNILIKPSTINFKDNHWILNPKSDKNHVISYNTSDQSIRINSFEAQSGEEQIQIKGQFHSLQNYGLSLSMDKVQLEKSSLSRKKFDLKGVMDLRLDIQRSPSNNTLSFNGFVNDFILNDSSMGSLRFFTTGNTQLNSYEVNASLTDNENTSMEVKGSVLGFDQSPRLNLDFNFNDFDLSFLDSVGGDNISNIRGEVSGKVNLWGPIDAPRHNGQLILDKGGLGVPEINVDYRIADGTRVNLIDQTFKFNTTTLQDTRYNTQAEVEGNISHLNFLNWSFDFDITSERILALNIPEDEDEIFFGDGFLKGNVHLHGPSKNLTIDVVGSTEKGTSIKIPWAKDYGLADTSFIKFIDKKKNKVTQTQNSQDIYNFSGLQMNFELDVNNNAEIKVVIDKESGSFLSGHGAGNILMEIDTKGKFNMWGDFITFDGIYNFKNLGVIDKKFNLKQGGTIVWEGDPLGAQMDLEAVYDVPGGANPALLLDNPNFNRKIPTEVLIRLQGNLLKPDDPIFEIDFPNTSAVFTSEINYRLADPQISQLQAISLLSQGIFINEVSLSVQGITNNLYEKASDLFSNLLGDDDGKLQVGLNYLQGDKSKLSDINTEDRLGLTLSTQITDKILLNGNIGVPVGGIEETLIVGDLQIDFILNDEGSLKAKVFNKENEFRYIGDELGYTQGVGLSYQVDFETFRELLTKIVKGNPTNQTIENQSRLNNPSKAGINFINKK